MASIIKQLPSDVIDKIAAGEVIERPASVVKELVENSIDACAKNVHILIKDGGQNSICVVDDGNGMTSEDLNNCYKRHATSKMSLPSDLFNINSLGFRGEALSSISSVSAMLIESCARGEKIGTRLSIEAGVIKNQGVASHAEGSSVTVKNLFYNTPARRKFLKKVETESRHISRVVINLAAAYPHIGFVLEHNNRQIMRLLKSSYSERAADLLAISEDDLIWVEVEQDGIQFRCALCYDTSKIRRKRLQYVVVRDRPIISRCLSDAIYSGCRDFLSEDENPAFIAWLNLDPKKIDVNVHPSKREIRIENELEVAKLISESIRNFIVPSEVKSFKIDIAKETEFKNQDDHVEENIGSFTSVNVKNEDGRSRYGSSGSNYINTTQNEFILNETSDHSGQRNGIELSQLAFAEKNIWQSYGSFLLVPLKEGLLVIDQKSAHERILYERANSPDSIEEKFRQQLLVPLILKLDRESYETSIIFEEILDSMGFSITPFGELTLAINSIPNDIRRWEDGELFRGIVEDLGNENENDSTDRLREAFARSFSKRACVDTETELKDEEIRQIFRDLIRCEDPYFTPDGIPIISRVEKSDLQRLLGRI